jgi:hypothetical protein
MGWWSVDILGGDTPLDFEDTFFDIAGIEEFPDSGGQNSITKKALEKSYDKMAVFVKENIWGDGNIGWQVLAVTCMKVGFIPPVTDLAEMKQACVNDEWAQEDEERKEVIDGLLKALNQYDGTPIKIKSKGLFEVMAEKMSKGNGGLINKGPGIG